jgi:branched-chain amino acid aminotransferase
MDAFVAPLAVRPSPLASAATRTVSHAFLGSRGAPAVSRTSRRGACVAMAAVPGHAAPPAAAQLDWENLGFQYVDTRCYVTATHKDGAWGALETVAEPYIRMHIGATALHYGCSCFEGLKCFRAADGVARLFRPDENAKRMRGSAGRLMIPPVPEAMFLDAVRAAVRENREYIPPYGTGGSLYVRPLLFGSGARIGLQPADEFTFLVMVVPVGDYYRGGLSPVTAIVTKGFDRAAPNGLGNVKVAGNYAADLLPNTHAKRAGFPINLYLDAQNGRTIEEFGTSNFIALKGNSYVTPDSKSVLPSITNKTLMQLARDGGMLVEQREVDIDEVREFDEAAACGTAVVITAVTRILNGGDLITIGTDPDAVGPRLKELYNQVRGIQVGELPDAHGWCFAVEGA